MSDIKDKYEQMSQRANPWDEIRRLKEENKILKGLIKEVRNNPTIPPDDPIRQVVL